MANGIIRLNDGWRLNDGHRMDEPPHPILLVIDRRTVPIRAGGGREIPRPPGGVW